MAKKIFYLVVIGAAFAAVIVMDLKIWNKIVAEIVLGGGFLTILTTDFSKMKDSEK